MKLFNHNPPQWALPEFPTETMVLMLVGVDIGAVHWKGIFLCNNRYLIQRVEVKVKSIIISLIGLYFQ